MDNLKEYAKNKIDKLNDKIAKKALEIGIDSGDGILKTLERLDNGTASELERRRANNAPIEEQIELLNLMFERSKLQRTYFPPKYDTMNEKVPIKELLSVKIVK